MSVAAAYAFVCRGPDEAGTWMQLHGPDTLAALYAQWFAGPEKYVDAHAWQDASPHA